MSFWTTVFDILFVLFFVALNGFFVAAEFAIVKVRMTQIDSLVFKGHLRAKIAKDIITHLDAYLSATQLGITMAS
ncbi:MAG TPA: CNNM domain-containing protein, partial [Bacteroidota bacterium]|nr:CNNM domain-containing protein [Bacteroidota bacterium]